MSLLSINHEWTIDQDYICFVPSLHEKEGRGKKTKAIYYMMTSWLSFEQFTHILHCVYFNLVSFIFLAKLLHTVKVNIALPLSHLDNFYF